MERISGASHIFRLIILHLKTKWKESLNKAKIMLLLEQAFYTNCGSTTTTRSAQFASIRAIWGAFYTTDNRYIYENIFSREKCFFRSFCNF